MDGWIDRQVREPDLDASIIVWEESWLSGAVVCYRDYESWLAAGSGRDAEFRYWMPSPPSPASPHV